MNFEALKFWIWVIHLTVTTVLAAYVWIAERRTARRTYVDEALSRHNDRIIVLEQLARVALTHDDLGPVYERLNGVDGAVREMAGELRALNINFTMLFQDRLQQDHPQREKQ